MEDGGFEWDSHNLEHIKAHNVSAAEAEQALLNEPLYLTENPQSSSGEVRWIVYGQTNQFRCLVVVFTERGPRVRVVTAYEMDARQRKDYLAWRTQLSEAEDDEYSQNYGIAEEND